MSSHSIPGNSDLEQDAEVDARLDGLIVDVAAEVDLEIAIRQRLVSTLESRLEWAVTLQEALRQVNGNADLDTYRAVALEALQAGEVLSDLMLSHNPLPPAAVNSTRFSRPAPRKAVPPVFPKVKPNFLFIRSISLQKGERDVSGNYLYLLRCPVCSRTAFTSLQGLLNHARLTHNLEWGTHDECIQACIVPDNDLDVNSGMEVAAGPTGILPGLRTIFQMAVGTHEPKPAESIGDTDKSHQPDISLPIDLNQTLGLHQETPTLAPYLGKEAIRRRINVFEEHTDVDIETLPMALPTIKASGQVAWKPSNRKQNEVALSKAVPDEEDPHHHPNRHISPAGQAQMPISAFLPTTADSRFHLVARIIITDRSLWIPPDERAPDFSAYTHKWSIAVDSPSYTHHISTVLQRIEVTASDVNTLLPMVPTISPPPFLVMGLAEKPFLARIKLSFNGTRSTDSEQSFVFEHWVDLYPMPHGHVVKGEDQVIDVDLDQDTLMRPAQRSFVPVESRSWWNRSPEAAAASASCGGLTPPNEYEEILADIVERFPMTLSDVKGRRSAVAVPYTLASSAQELFGLNYGRRKAIEWSRARAVQAAYEAHRADRREPTLLDLSVADVYCWLSENGHSLHGNGSALVPETSQSRSWCQFCGLDSNTHEMAILKKEQSDNAHATQPPAAAISCPILPPELQITKLPLISIDHKLMQDDRIAQSEVSLNDQSLLNAADPILECFIRGLVLTWGLRSFTQICSTTETNDLMPIDDLGVSPSNKTKLAPTALLALISRQLIHELITRGLKVAERDKATALSFITPRGRRRNQVIKTRLLTPTHILSAILTGGLGRDPERHPIDAALLIMFSQPGMQFEDRRGDHHCTTQIKPED